jgi:signal transduction histidine kinase/ligand-binding sensor domain-containing protein
MARLIIVLAVLIWALSAPGPARALDPTRGLKQLQHTAWTIEGGMPGSIRAIAQTPDGYLWLGAVGGLYRFDGVRAERFAIQPAGMIYAMAATSGGDLWIGTAAGLFRLSHGVLTRFTVPGLATASVRLMVIGRDDQVWIATDSQVARFDGRGWQVMQSDWGSSGSWWKTPGGVWGLAVARDGVVWAKNVLATYYLRPGATRFVQAEGYGGGIVNFSRGADGRLWTADTASHRFYVLPDLRAGVPPPPPRLGAPAPAGVLGWTMLDRDGALWCANSITGGLYRMRSISGAGSGAEMFTSQDGLSGGTPDALLEDREGDVWVATDNGLDRFSPANVVTETSIPIRGQRTDIAASDRALYIASGWRLALPKAAAEHVFRVGPDGAPRALPFDLGNIDSFNTTASGALLIGSGPKLMRVDGDKLRSVALPPEAAGATAVSAADNGKELWVCLEGRGVFRRVGGVWSKVLLPGASDATPLRVRLDQQGAFWILAIEPENTTVYRMAGGQLAVFRGSSGPRVGSLYAFAAEPDGALFGGEDGVARFDGRSFQTLSTSRAPYLAWTLGIVSDGRGGVWFTTPVGIVRTPTTDLERAFQDGGFAPGHQMFDARDGLRASPPTDQFGGLAARGPDGRLWFVTGEAIAWIDPRRFYRNLVPPPVAIRSLAANGRTLDPAPGLRLAAGTSDLQIDYTALSLQNPQRVRFRYRLTGVDKGWTDAGARREAFYTRLEPGRYRFQVIAANNDGVWNDEGASLAFVIPPTFVQSDWFLLLCAAVAALVLWALYLLRMRQLAASIQSRLEERIAERERIARELHDTLLQGVQGLILRFQAIMDGLPAGQAAKAQLNAVLERADDVLAAGRDRVSHLRAASGVDDLVEALIRAAEMAPRAPDTEIRITTEGEPRDLHPIVTEEVSAIGREAIVNALKHANARHIDVVIAYDRHGLALRIADDGVGIVSSILDAGGRAGHFGLIGMRERARKIGGQLALASRDGTGTAVTLRVAAHAAFVAPAAEPAALRWLRDRWARLRGPRFRGPRSR